MPALSERAGFHASGFTGAHNESTFHGRQGKRTRLPGVALRRGRRPHGRRGRSAQGHGLCDGGRPAGGGGAVHRLHPDGDLRAARLVARAQRQLHHHPGDPDRHATRPGGPRRRSGEARHRDRDAHRAGRRDAGAGAADAPGLRRQLHFHAGAGRLQGGHRPRHRAGPGAEAPGHPHHQAGLLPRPSQRRAAPSRHVADDAGRGRGDVRGPDRHGAAVAAFSGAAGRRRRRHCRVVVLRPAGARRLDGRPDSARLAGAHAAGRLR